MPLIDELAAEVATLLGISYTFDQNNEVQWQDLPPVEHVKRWIYQAQREIVAHVPADTIPALWRVTSDPDLDAIIPGTRILSVLVGGVEARIIPLHESRTAQQPGSLFGATGECPAAWVESEDLGGGESRPVIRTYPPGTPTVTYVAPGVDGSGKSTILLPESLYPLCVAIAHYLAAISDDDIEASTVSLRNLQRIEQQLGVSFHDRLGAPAAGERDAS